MRISVKLLTAGVVLLIFLTSLSLHAQEEFFSVMPDKDVSTMKTRMNVNQSEVMDKTHKDKNLKKMDMVHIGNLSKIQKDGFLTFTLPRLGKITAKGTKIEYFSEDNYKWIGEINGNQFGYVYLYSDRGNVYGHITVDNQSYQIKGLGGNISILAEMDTEKMKGKMCGTVGGKNQIVDEKDHIIDTGISSARIDPCASTDRVRVLVVYTARALAAVGLQTIRDRVNVSIDQFNEAFRVSGVTDARAQLELAGLEATTFRERPQNADNNANDNDAQDVADLPTLTEQRRIATNADIVIAIVEANYINSRGRA